MFEYNSLPVLCLSASLLPASTFSFTSAIVTETQTPEIVQ